MKSLFALCMLMVVACGGDDGGSSAFDASPGGAPDAPPAPMFDAAPPIMACNEGAVPDPLTVNGTVTDLIEDEVLEGATVTLREGGSVIDTATSDENGLVTFSLVTGGEAWEGNITIEAEDYLTTLVFPTQLSRNLEDIPMPVLTPAQRDLGAILAGADLDETKGTIVAAFIDCDDMGVAGVSYGFSTEVETLYLDGDSVDPNATATDESGIALAFNVDPGTVTVTANQGGAQASIDVTAEADSITLAIFVF